MRAVAVALDYPLPMLGNARYLPAGSAGASHLLWFLLK